MAPLDMTPPRLREAHPADLPAIERLLAASDLPLDGVRDHVATFVVADAGGDIVGVAGAECCDEHALLRSVAVHPAWRAHGVGRALVTRVIADADARGTRALYLLTTTAERYFPAFGFRPITRDEVPDDIRATAEFRTVCPASATVMRSMSCWLKGRPSMSCTMNVRSPALITW